MPVLRNINKLAQCKQNGAQGEVHEIDHAALVWESDKIIWVGREKELPQQYKEMQTIDAKGRLVTPGLIDCHTHLCFAGWREKEFEQRILGKSYLEIARAGGGILSTTKTTREASFEQLLNRCKDFLEQIKSLGVTTIECKSGYGLSLEHELKILRVYKTLAETQSLGIVATFLGAHTVPAEFKNNSEAYVNLIIDQMLPAVKSENLATFCDVFHEKGAFETEATIKILKQAQKLGFGIKLHADQLSDMSGARLAAQFSAVSADHLECISDSGIQALSASAVVAVLLPIASLYTQQKALNARKLLDSGVKVAIATDFNPGTAPTYHLPLSGMLACNLNGLTPKETLKSLTTYAAKALNLEQTLGSLEPGKSADFAIFDCLSVEQWLYNFIPNACASSFKNGKMIYYRDN